MLLLASTAANIAFAIGAAIVSFFLIRRSRRYLARSAAESSAKSSSAGPQSSPESSRDAERVSSTEVLRGQVQLHETARELMGQLDSKMSALQTLIRSANDAATRLETAIDRAQRLGLAARRDTLEDLANLPATDETAAARLIGDLSAGTERQIRIDQEHYAELVVNLAREGRNAQSIASELGIAIGDVEMLLSLHRR